MSFEPTGMGVLSHAQTIDALLKSSKEAFIAVSKGSKLSTYTKRLVIINNLMRAFMEHYELPAEVVEDQKLLKHVLTQAEYNKRVFTTKDKICLGFCLKSYELLIRSASEDQLHEMFEYVDNNAQQCKTVFTNNKVGKRVIRRKG